MSAESLPELDALLANVQTHVVGWAETVEDGGVYTALKKSEKALHDYLKTSKIEPEVAAAKLGKSLFPLTCKDVSAIANEREQNVALNIVGRANTALQKMLDVPNPPMDSWQPLYPQTEEQKQDCILAFTEPCPQATAALAALSDDELAGLGICAGKWARHMTGTQMAAAPSKVARDWFQSIHRPKYLWGLCLVQNLDHAVTLLHDVRTHDGGRAEQHGPGAAKLVTAWLPQVISVLEACKVVEGRPEGFFARLPNYLDLLEEMVRAAPRALDDERLTDALAVVMSAVQGSGGWAISPSAKRLALRIEDIFKAVYHPSAMDMAEELRNAYV